MSDREHTSPALAVYLLTERLTMAADDAKGTFGVIGRDVMEILWPALSAEEQAYLRARGTPLVDAPVAILSAALASRARTIAAADELECLKPPKWRKPCPDSVILFATDGRGQVCIIDHQGPDAAYILGDSLQKEMLIDDDLALWKFPGLWVWEGRVRSSRSYDGEYDEEYVGEVRPLTEDEARAVREDDHLWDGSRWIEDWKP